jgi:hypothetical protein
MFILQQCLNPNPYSNPNFFSDSDPAKTFGLFRIRIRIHNTGCITAWIAAGRQLFCLADG